LSTLTKVLIVLLTISSIFLCGIVVTYVAHADNYRSRYNDLKADADSFREKVKSLTAQVNEKVAQNQQLQQQFSGQITTLRSENTKLQNDLKTLEREKATLLQKVNNWTSITRDFHQTNQQQGQLLEQTLAKLEQVRAEQIKQKKQLQEVSMSLLEKMAVIDTLTVEQKRLQEEKVELQNRLDEQLKPLGKVAGAPELVTRKNDIALPVVSAPVAAEISLEALITEVDLKNSLASISAGTADGVEPGMKLHVTRGDKFVCDLLIIEADTDQAVGVLELVQHQPKVGDNASTDL